MTSRAFSVDAAFSLHHFVLPTADEEPNVDDDVKHHLQAGFFFVFPSQEGERKDVNKGGADGKCSF